MNKTAQRYQALRRWLPLAASLVALVLALPSGAQTTNRFNLELNRYLKKYDKNF